MGLIEDIEESYTGVCRLRNYAKEQLEIAETDARKELDKSDKARIVYENYNKMAVQLALLVLMIKNPEKVYNKSTPNETQ